MKIQNNYLYSLGISKGMTLPDYLVVDRKDRMTEEEVIKWKKRHLGYRYKFTGSLYCKRITVKINPE